MVKLTIKLEKTIDLKKVESLTNGLESFSSDILLINDYQEANCKSLINLLAIGISALKVLNFRIKGSDEQEVKKFIIHFFNN